MKKICGGMLLQVLLIILLLTGCTSNLQGRNPQSDKEETEREGLIVVGFSQVGAESDWRNANTESFRSAFTEENGFYVIYEDAQQKQENQIKALRSFILQEVDYIILNPIVETGWDSVLEEAHEAGIPVIISDRRVEVEDESLYTCWFGSNFLEEGERAGEWLADYLKQQKREKEPINIVTLQGTLGSTAQIGRSTGFDEVLKKHPNWTMLDREEGDFTQAKGQEVMKEFLSRYEKIDVVISENDNMAFGAIEAIKESGRTCGPEGEITVISFDAVRAALERIQKGEINADFECNPLSGPHLTEIVKKLARGESVDKINYIEETYFDASMELSQVLESRAY